MQGDLVKELSISIDGKILDAIEVIESCRLQIAFVIDKDQCLLGVITNGDVRRYLLEGGLPGSAVTQCMNCEFRAITQDSSREEMLKIFDLGYSAIPVLDENGRLVNIYTKQMAAKPEAPVLARARAPVRMSFCGGGADLTYFFVEHSAAVLSCTIGLYAHATLIPRKDQAIHLYSEDLGKEEFYLTLSDLINCENKGLLATVASLIKPEYGFDLYLRSDFPVGSGLGGSSAATIATIAAFNEMRQDRWNTYDIAELAFQAERLCFGIAGGWQDQYASSFGGFNLIEFENQKNLVHPIRLEDSIRNELESCLVLCDTNTAHNSGQLHELQKQEMTAESSKVDKLRASVELCRRMHKYLIRGDLRDFGLCLDEAWQLKKRFSSAVSHSQLDHIYDTAIAAGALGGKLLGAGAGGFFLFYIQPQYRHRLIKAVSGLGCKVRNFRFESSGVTSWRTKIQ